MSPAFASAIRVGEGGRLRPLLGVLSPGRYIGAIVGLVAVSAYLALTRDVFMTWPNWQNIFRANAIVLILALGMTFVVITAGIDLSVASMTVAAGMVFGLALQAGLSWPVALLATLAVGTAMGLVNGILIGLAGISFFVVTLGTLSIYASVALLTTFGDTITLYNLKTFASSQSLANETLGPLPAVFVLCIGLYLVGGFVLRYTSFGRSVYAVGSNREAARLTGITVPLVLVAVYTISGLCAGLAGIVATGRLGAAAPQVEPTLMLTVVAAVLIGGTSYTGGEGGLVGTVIGVFFLGVVQNGLTLSSVSAFWQGTVSGLILIVAVGIGVLRTRGPILRRRHAGVRAAVRATVRPGTGLDPKRAAATELESAEREARRLRAELEHARGRVDALEAAVAEAEGRRARPSASMTEANLRRP